jgi:hypothetical protein
VVDGRWELSATIFNFQGLDRENSDTPNDVKIHLAIYDREQHRAYMGPIVVRLVHDGSVVASFERESVDEEATYTTRETLPESGRYELVVQLDSDSASLPFEIEIAGDGPNAIWISVFVLALAAVTVIGFLGRPRTRSRRKRKARPAHTTASAASAGRTANDVIAAESRLK